MENTFFIATPRLRLRELTIDDLDRVHAYISDIEVARHSAWGPLDLEQTRAFLQTVQLQREASPRLNYGLAITGGEDGRVVGSASLNIMSAENREAEIGYTLARNEWGKGYATEVAGALLDYGFNQLQLHRIRATASPLNLKSQRVLEKIGMKREGILRQNILMRGVWRDSVLYAVLESDRE